MSSCMAAAATGEAHSQPSLLYSRRNRGRSGEALVAAELRGLEWSLPIVYRVPLTLSAPRLAAPAPSSCNADACSVQIPLSNATLILSNLLLSVHDSTVLQLAEHSDCIAGVLVAAAEGRVPEPPGAP